MPPIKTFNVAERRREEVPKADRTTAASPSHPYSHDATWALRTILASSTFKVVGQRSFTVA